jgi:hypothetical protein
MVDPTATGVPARSGRDHSRGRRASGEIETAMSWLDRQSVSRMSMIASRSASAGASVGRGAAGQGGWTGPDRPRIVISGRRERPTVRVQG